jgi:hypothetical protein
MLASRMRLVSLQPPCTSVASIFYGDSPENDCSVNCTLVTAGSTVLLQSHNLANIKGYIMCRDFYFFYLDCETIGTAATPGLLCQPRVIMKMIVESMLECRLSGETEVLGENLPQRYFCPSQNPTSPPGFEPGPPWWEAGD